MAFFTQKFGIVLSYAKCRLLISFSDEMDGAPSRMALSCYLRLCSGRELPLGILGVICADDVACRCYMGNCTFPKFHQITGSGYITAAIHGSKMEVSFQLHTLAQWQGHLYRELYVAHKCSDKALHEDTLTLSSRLGSSFHSGRCCQGSQKEHSVANQVQPTA